ncbi:MAG: DUF3737 family protein [Paludibacteraceae bacterium]|nr:DUF3737 family protein [Paludibacteraceae bacterium]
MTIIKNNYFSGERPLYESRDIELRNVTIGEGESGLKESRGIMADHCIFEGMYVLWECEDVECYNCHFAASDRAPVWYTRRISLTDCTLDAPKAFREIDGLTIERMQMTDGAEAFWRCRDGQIADLRLENGHYPFFQSERLSISQVWLIGKYAFQYTRDIEIHNAFLDTKDAFWNSENVTVYDSELKGEYLGWYAKNLRLVRCRISGTQPLCYCDNLILEECSFAPDADRALERSTYRIS